MELKRLITQFVYRIEPKPEGGFIARASDPNVPPLEAPTREELQQKIQATITAGLAAQFPGLKLPLPDHETHFNFHIESKPGGGFAIHSADPGAPPIEGTQEEIENHFAEKLITLAEKLSPELSQALAQQGASGDIKVFVDRKTFSLNPNTHKLGLGLGRSLATAGSIGPGDASTEDAISGDANTVTPGIPSVGNSISNSPITPEGSGSGSIFLFLLTVLVLAALAYFFLYHR